MVMGGELFIRWLVFYDILTRAFFFNLSRVTIQKFDIHIIYTNMLYLCIRCIYVCCMHLYLLEFGNVYEFDPLIKIISL